MDDTRTLLSNAGAKQNWLLVLDNADSPDTDYARYFPSGTRGVVLITSRNPDCCRYGTVGTEELGALDDNDPLNLLFDAANVPRDLRPRWTPAAKRVTIALQSHTLALLQAGAYVSQGHCSLEEYPDLYQRQCARLLQFSPKQADSRYSTVYATFEASAQALESNPLDESQDALILLGVLSTLHYENVPLDLFKDAWNGARFAQNNPEDDKTIDNLARWHVSQLPPFLGAGDNAWDPFRFSAALNRLRALALIRKNNTEGVLTVSMHPLAHRWMAIRQDHIHKVRYLQLTGCFVALSRYRQPDWRPYRSHLGLHLHHFLEGKRTLAPQEHMPRHIVQILMLCGWILEDLRYDRDLANLLDWIFGELDISLDSASLIILPIYHLAARNKYNLGQTKKAIEVFERVAEVREITLDEKHPDRLATQHELGRAYLADGQTKKAIEVFEKVAEVDGITLDEKHPDRLTTQHELSRAYLADGQTKKAIEVFEKVAEVRGITLDEKHPDRLTTQHALGRAYLADGQTKKAIEVFKKVAEVYGITLDEKHPDRLATQHALSSAYLADGQTKKAIEVFEKVAEVDRITLDEKHPDRLTTQHELGRAYLADGQTKKAIEVFEKVAEVRGITLDEKHPDRLATQHELGRAYLADGQADGMSGKYFRLLIRNSWLTFLQNRTENSRDHELVSNFVALLASLAFQPLRRQNSRLDP